jgi:hypothetical protein
MKQRNKTIIYCRCEICQIYFDVTMVKRSKFCSKSCRDKKYYITKKAKLNGKLD